MNGLGGSLQFCVIIILTFSAALERQRFLRTPKKDWGDMAEAFLFCSTAISAVPNSKT